MKKIIIAGRGQVFQENMGEILSCIPKKLLRRMPIYVRNGLCASICALRDAEEYPCPSDTGIVIGTWYGCQKTSFDFMDTIISDGSALSSPLDFSHSVNNVAAALISMALKAEGPAITVMSGEQSFIGALQLGMTLLENDKCRHILVGSLEESDPRMKVVFPDDKINPACFFLYMKNAEY